MSTITYYRPLKIYNLFRNVFKLEDGKQETLFFLVALLDFGTLVERRFRDSIKNSETRMVIKKLIMVVISQTHPQRRLCSTTGLLEPVSP